MSVELLQTLSLVSYILAGVLFLLAIALFFLLNVPKLFGDVTGSTARKAIESIRQQNEESGDKAYKPSPINAERGKLTDKISPSGRLESRINLGVAPGTEKFSTTELSSQAQAQDTTVLAEGSNETTVLNNEPTETTILNSEATSGETTILTQADTGSEFSVDVEIGFTGSSEIIE